MPADVFVKIDGVEGESSDATHKNEIEVLSYSWGVTEAITGIVSAFIASSTCRVAQRGKVMSMNSRLVFAVAMALLLGGVAHACFPPQVECGGRCGTDCGNGLCCPDPAHPVCSSDGLLFHCEGQSGPGQVACSDAGLGFADVVCCGMPSRKKECQAACAGLVLACRSSCSNSAHPKRCKKRCGTFIVNRCKQSQPHVCG
jgi:type VI secretion system (T6SS) effector Hcp